MALVLYLTCALFAGLAAWVLLDGNLGGTRLVTVHMTMAMHAGRRMVERMAATEVMALLLKHDAFRAVTQRMAQLLTRGTAGLDLAESGSITLMALVATTCLGGLLSRSLVGALVLLVACVVGMRVWSSNQWQKRRRALSASMPGVLRTMATALESGQTLVQAVEYVGLHEHGPAAEAFARASLRLRCGMSLTSALHDLEKELDAPGMDLVVTALLVSQRTGSPLRTLLRQSADLVEQQEEFERLLAVRTAQVRLSVRIVCTLPPLMVCLLALISPDFQQGIVSGPGMASLFVAACADGIALLLIRRVMAGALL